VCLAHLTDTERTAYLTGLAPSADIDHRGTPFTQGLLEALLNALNDPSTGKPHLGRECHESGVDLPRRSHLMSTSTGHLIESAEGVLLAVAGESAEGAEVKSMPVSVNGLSAELLEELAALAAERTAEGGLRLMGEGGILPELAQHLMQAALEAEMDLGRPAGAGHARAATPVTATGPRRS
jgi:hypothetical protein